MSDKQEKMTAGGSPARDPAYAEKIHARLLLMMKELHRICVDNHITYYMIGGTALGARRHKGFIPWDDDADIAMPRPDYERFSALPRSAFPDFLELRWYRNTENSPFQYIKFIDNRTTLREDAYGDYLEGLYIDIFPIDGVGPDGTAEYLRRESVWMMHRMVRLKRSTYKLDKLKKKVAAIFVKRMDLERMHETLEALLKRVEYENSPRVANFLGAWGKREIVDKRLFGAPKLYPFEDTALYGPELMDEYLTCVYGDFMTPPPPEQCVFRHQYPLLDLETSFREYKQDR